MRIVLVCAVVVGLVVGAPVAAAADIDVGAGESDSAEVVAGIGDVAESIGDPGWEPPDPEDVGVFLEFREHLDPDDPDDNGSGYCYEFVVRVYEGAAAAAELQYPDAPIRAAMIEHGRCPDDDTDEFYEALDRYAAGLPVPAPTPTVPPGRAITGVPAYLDAGGQRYHEVSLDIFGGQFTAWFHHAGYDVNWGDGSEVRRYDHAQIADPYPDGDIRYAYATRGASTVTVTQYWAGWWSYSGIPNAIPPVSSRRIPGVLWSVGAVDLQVDDAEAIRGR